jgi:hypothetical protein
MRPPPHRFGSGYRVVNGWNDCGRLGRFRRQNFLGAWIAIALGLVALTEAAVIAWLAIQKPASPAEPAVVIESPGARSTP